MGPRLLGRSEVTAKCPLCSPDCPVRGGDGEGAGSYLCTADPPPGALSSMALGPGEQWGGGIGHHWLVS